MNSGRMTDMQARKAAKEFEEIAGFTYKRVIM